MLLYVDGGCSGNDQHDLAARRMIAVVTDCDGAVVSERRMVGGSNNIAELEAVHDALAWCVARGIPAVDIHTDSRNNLSWVLGTKIGKHLNDRQRVLDLKSSIATLRRSVQFTLTWVPRDDNLAGHYIEDKHGL